MLRSLVVLGALLLSLSSARAEPGTLETRLSAPDLVITFEAPGEENGQRRVVGWSKSMRQAVELVGPAEKPVRAKLMVDLRPANVVQSRAFLVHAINVLAPGSDAATLGGFVDGNLTKLKPGQAARTTAGGRAVELTRESDVMATAVVQAK